MRLTKIGDSGTLEVMALSYKVNRILNKEHNVTPPQSAVLLLIGAYTMQNKNSEEVASLSVPEVVQLIGYSRSNRQRIYYTMQGMTEGSGPYLRKEKRKRVAYYSLTARGLQIIREAINQAKICRFELTQINATQAA